MIMVAQMSIHNNRTCTTLRSNIARLSSEWIRMPVVPIIRGTNSTEIAWLTQIAPIVAKTVT